MHLWSNAISVIILGMHPYRSIILLVLEYVQVSNVYIYKNTTSYTDIMLLWVNTIYIIYIMSIADVQMYHKQVCYKIATVSTCTLNTSHQCDCVYSWTMQSLCNPQVRNQPSEDCWFKLVQKQMIHQLAASPVSQSILNRVLAHHPRHVYMTRFRVLLHVITTVCVFML